MSAHRTPGQEFSPGGGSASGTVVDTIRRAWRALNRWSLRGTWRPGAHNVVLLIAQVVIIWTAAQRGMDYVNTPNVAEPGAAGPTVAYYGVESISLTLLGYSFLLPAGAAFISLATGWAKPLSLAHLFIGASYLVLGITFLREAPIDDWLTAAGGSLLLVLSALLLVGDSRRIPDVVAILIGALMLGVGGWLAADGLGYGYRTGNGFLGAAVLHFIFGFGTQVLARREARLRREEEEDFRELGVL